MADEHDPNAQIAAALQQLANNQQELNERVARLQQEQQVAARPAPPPPSATDLDAANRGFLDNFVQNPLRVTQEIISVAEQRAETKLRAEMEQREQLRIAEERRVAWEAAWLQQNPDIADPDVKVAFETALRQQNPNLPYETAVEQAAAATRQWKLNVQQKVLAAQESERHRKAAASMPMPTGYGSPNMTPPQDELAMRREMVQQEKQAMLAKRLRTPRAVAAE